MTPQERLYYDDLFYLMGLLEDRRELLERCLAHLDRLIERYVQINAGDRKLHRELQAHLRPPKENA